MRYLKTLFLISFIIQLQSISILEIKEQEVRGELFYKYLSNDISNLFSLSATSSFTRDKLNPSKCSESLSSIVSQMPSQKVAPFIDSSGRIPSGILKRNFVSMGNFDQCLEISVELNDDIGVVNGQYCYVFILPKTNFNRSSLIQNNSITSINIINAINIPRLKIGICVPDSCSSEELKPIFQNAVNQSLVEISINQCRVKRRSDFDAYEWTGIIFFSISGAFIALSSSYELLMRFLKKTPQDVLLAFSIFSNGKKIFAINTNKSPNSIQCLAGIRVLSMAWVLYCHNYLFTALMPLINTIDIKKVRQPQKCITWYYIISIPKWSRTAWSLHVIEATVSVDTFLFMSGLLIAWLGFQELDKKGKLNILRMYVHRYIRLTPPVGGVIIFLISIYKLVLIGPNERPLLALNGQCPAHWWVTLLYIQNYLRTDEICVPQTWYLAVDFQLYILSPFLLVPMWKWGKKCFPVFILLIVLSIGCVIGIFFSEGYNNFIDVSSEERMRKVYFPTHTRYSAWLVGLSLGYFMHINRQKVFKPSKITQFLGWMICFITILAVIFGPYFTMNSNRSISIIEAALYDSLKRISWSIAVAWIVFACHFQIGGLVNSFLSHALWQPLSRLTYSLYLVHLAVIGINFGTVRTESNFSQYNEVLLFWSTFGMSFVAALTLSLAFEAPILVLEKAIFGEMKLKQEESEPDLTITQNKINFFPTNRHNQSTDHI